MRHIAQRGYQIALSLPTGHLVHRKLSCGQHAYQIHVTLASSAIMIEVTEPFDSAKIFVNFTNPFYSY
jgi:hypothetical protein